MKGILTATCLAASFAVGLAAQSTTSSATQTPPPESQRGGGPRTATGCLRTGDTAGSYMLTDVQMGGAARPGDTTAGSTAGGAGTTGAGSATSATQGDRGMTPTSIMLMPAADVDLKPHVGHKIEVTGTMAGRGRGNAGAAGGTSTTATGGTSTTTGGTATGSATTGSSTATGSTTDAQGRGGRGGPRGMNVTSVRMVSESCS